MKIKNIVYKKLQSITKNKFDDNSIVNDIGIDSLDLIQLVTEVEDEFNVEISDSDLESIKTISDIIKVFEKSVK